LIGIHNNLPGRDIHHSHVLPPVVPTTTLFPLIKETLVLALHAVLEEALLSYRLALVLASRRSISLL
jgi:hypothetical protein